MARNRNRSTSNNQNTDSTTVEPPTEVPQEDNVSSTTDEALPEGASTDTSTDSSVPEDPATDQPNAGDTVDSSGELTDDTITDDSADAADTDSTDSEPEIDLGPFTEAVDEAVSGADETTGDIAVEPLSKVTEQYRKLDGAKPKNAAKKVVNDRMKAAMDALDIRTARAYLQISENALTAGAGGGGSTRTPTDPTEAFVQRVATLRLALDLVDENVPEEVASDWQTKLDDLLNGKREQANEYRTWFESEADDKGDEPSVEAFVKNAVKLAEGKSARAGAARSSSGSSGGSGYSGERRNIGKHILEAFADLEEGTFLSIAQIRQHKSSEYGDDLPSAGAISARLFPDNDGSKCSLIKDGVQPGTDEKGKKGARKVAAQDSDAAA